jgi:hypothetical protein
MDSKTEKKVNHFLEKFSVIKVQILSLDRSEIVELEVPMNLAELNLKALSNKKDFVNMRLASIRCVFESVCPFGSISDVIFQRYAKERPMAFAIQIWRHSFTEISCVLTKAFGIENTMN